MGAAFLSLRDDGFLGVRLVANVAVAEEGHQHDLLPHLLHGLDAVEQALLGIRVRGIRLVVQLDQAQGCDLDVVLLAGVGIGALRCGLAQIVLRAGHAERDLQTIDPQRARFFDGRHVLQTLGKRPVADANLEFACRVLGPQPQGRQAGQRGTRSQLQRVTPIDRWLTHNSSPLMMPNAKGDPDGAQRSASTEHGHRPLLILCAAQGDHKVREDWYGGRNRHSLPGLGRCGQARAV